MPLHLRGLCDLRGSTLSERVRSSVEHEVESVASRLPPCMAPPAQRLEPVVATSPRLRIAGGALLFHVKLAGSPPILSRACQSLAPGRLAEGRTPRAALCDGVTGDALPHQLGRGDEASRFEWIGHAPPGWDSDHGRV